MQRGRMCGEAGWEQELMVQLTLPELRRQGVACRAVPEGKDVGKKSEQHLPSPSLILLYINTKYIYSIYRICYQLTQGNYYFNNCSSHSRFVLLLNYNLQFKEKKSDLYFH